MTSNIFHDAPTWRMTAPHEVQRRGLVPDMSNEELGHHPFMTESFPLIMNGDLDPWLMERVGWNGGIAPLPEQYAEKWDATYIGSEQKEQGISDPSCTYVYTDSAHLLPQWDGSGREQVMSQLATERALFMTPSAYPPSFQTFPGSPISDLCSTPDMSHAGSSVWEADPERDNVRSCLHPDNEMYMQAVSETPGMASGHSSGEDEDDYQTTLEMPDGSTRRTSNWLPVDLQAGFTIGSRFRKRTGHPSFIHLEDMGNIQEAFISPTAAGWKYDG